MSSCQCYNTLIVLINKLPQLLFKAETLYFTPGSVVCDKREPADRLMIVSNGSIDLFVYACNLTFQADVCSHPPIYSTTYLSSSSSSSSLLT